MPRGVRRNADPASTKAHALREVIAELGIDAAVDDIANATYEKFGHKVTKQNVYQAKNSFKKAARYERMMPSDPVRVPIASPAQMGLDDPAEAAREARAEGMRDAIFGAEIAKQLLDLAGGLENARQMLNLVDNLRK